MKTVVVIEIGVLKSHPCSHRRAPRHRTSIRMPPRVPCSFAKRSFHFVEINPRFNNSHPNPRPVKPPPVLLSSSRSFCAAAAPPLAALSSVAALTELASTPARRPRRSSSPPFHLLSNEADRRLHRLFLSPSLFSRRRRPSPGVLAAGLGSVAARPWGAM